MTKLKILAPTVGMIVSLAIDKLCIIWHPLSYDFSSPYCYYRATQPYGSAVIVILILSLCLLSV